MKTLNVPQFYKGFCCYFESTYYNFDKAIKLFTLSCLHCNIILCEDVFEKTPKNVIFKSIEIHLSIHKLFHNILKTLLCKHFKEIYKH